MMNEREVSLSEAQERLPDLLSDVERGETVCITRNGKQIARLTPAQANGARSEQDETPEEALARRTAIIGKFMRESDRADWARGRVTLEEIHEWTNEGRA